MKEHNDLLSLWIIKLIGLIERFRLENKHCNLDLTDLMDCLYTEILNKDNFEIDEVGH